MTAPETRIDYNSLAMERGIVIAMHTSIVNPAAPEASGPAIVPTGRHYAGSLDRVNHGAQAAARPPLTAFARGGRA